MNARKLSNVILVVCLIISSMNLAGCKKKKSESPNTTSGGAVIEPPAPTTPPVPTNPATQKLTFTYSGDGAGTLATSSQGEGCGTNCLQYPQGTEIIIIASPGSPADVFSGWSGACKGTGNCAVTLSSDKSVDAKFEKNNRTLSVTKSGNGGGSVDSTPSGISCGAECSKAYLLGAIITLTATPENSQSTFTGWSGACSGAANCVVTMDQSKNVSANFDQVIKTLTASKTGAGSGKINSTPAGIDCGTDCGENYLLNTIVSLTATPTDAGSEFDHWNGACSGSGNCSVTMSDNRLVEAVFRISQKSLGVTKGGSGIGTINSNPTGINCGLDCSETYNYNTVVTLTQNQEIGYFTGWSGACSGDKSCAVTMNDQKSVRALFETVSVDGDYCQSTAGLIICFFVRSNAVVQAAVGPDTSRVCYSNFYSGNTIANRTFNANNGSSQISGDFLSAYRVAGRFNGNCSFLSGNSFNFEATRPGASSVGAASAFRGFSNSGQLTYDPNAK